MNVIFKVLRSYHKNHMHALSLSFVMKDLLNSANYIKVKQPYQEQSQPTNHPLNIQYQMIYSTLARSV